MAWFFLSRVAASLIAVVTLLVLTRLLPPEAFGKYNLVLLSALAAQQLVFAWIVASVTRFDKAPEFGGRAVALGFGTAGFLVLGLVPLVVLVGTVVPSQWREAYVLTAVFAFGAGLHEAGLAGLRVQGRRKAFAVAVLSRPVVGTTLAAGLILAGGGYQSAILALFVGAAISGSFAVATVLRQSGLARPDWAVVRTFFHFGQPLAVVRSGSTAFILTTQFLLAWMIGLEEVGYFAAAIMLAQRSITMLMVTLGQTSAATIFQAHEDSGRKSVVEMLDEHFSFLLLVSAPLFVLFVFSGDVLARVMFGEEVGPGVAPYLPLVGAAALFNGLQAAFFAFAFSLKKRTVLQLGLSFALLALHIPTSAMLITMLGAIGAAHATALTAFFGMWACAWYGRDLFGCCALRVRTLQMAAAAAATIPFLVMADAQGSLILAVVLIGGGMLAMLAVLKVLRYSSLEAVFDAARRRSAK